MLLRFEPSGVEVHAHAGDRVVDIVDTHPGTGIPFSCRDANCGTCRVHVVEGAASLTPAHADERVVLATFADARRDVRLACQLAIADGAGARIVLRVVGS